jgi:transcriptional regulator with XRE-family HTH domain
MKTRSDNEQQLREYVPANVKRLREHSNLTQLELSKQLLAKHPKCGLTSKRISDIEINRSTIYFMEVIAYAAFFDCTPEALLEKPAAPIQYPLSLEEVREAAYHLTVRVERLEEAHNATNKVIDALEKSYKAFTVQVLNILQELQNAQILQELQDEPKELF